MKILITGIGITGKSTLRRMLKKIFSETGIIVKDIDGDYDKLPQKFENRVLYLIEDVHGLIEEESCLPLDNYNFIIYLLPNLFSHLIFWLKRLWRWFQLGQGSWDKKRQNWLGSGKKYDFSNIPIFAGRLIHDLSNRKKWIIKDIKVLSQCKKPVVFLWPQWTKGGIRFCLSHQFRAI